jgi:hypothetical protein
MIDLLPYIKAANSITVLILVTLCYAVYKLKKDSITNQLLILILLIGALCEFLTISFIVWNINFSIIYSLSFIIHGLSWLLLITREENLKKIKNLAISLFLIFSISNILFFEKMNLNYFTFIVGSFIYVSLYIYENYMQLNNENLDYFKTNKFILLFAPIPFFLGMSIVFSFRNSSVKEFFIINNIQLYTFIAYIVNIIYFFLINLYIYKEQKQ